MADLDSLLDPMRISAPTRNEASRLDALISDGRFREAEALARRLTLRYPSSFFAWKALGVALAATHRFLESEAALKRAVALAPRNPEILYELGMAHIPLAQWSQAEDCLRRALDLGQPSVRALNALAGLFGMQGRLEECETPLLEALRIGGEIPEVLMNLGASLASMNRLEEAEEYLRRALRARPGFAGAIHMLGGTLLRGGRFPEAREALRDSLCVNPGMHAARSDLLLCMNYGKHTPGEYLEEALGFGDAVKRARTFRFGDWDSPSEAPPLRVGFVSGDLRAHPVALFLKPLLEHLDSALIEAFAYATVLQEDGTTKELRRSFAAWSCIATLDDEAAARKIHTDRIQVLVDLSGHTANNRLAVFAYRPAPVQVSWLGYFASTGLDEIDYFVADPVTVPSEHAGQFVERVWRLPQTRLCFSEPQFDLEVKPLPALSRGHVTFCCFNNLAKVTEEVLALWARILCEVPEARLYLKAKQLAQESARQSYLERLVALGIDPARVRLEGPSPRHEYMASYDHADLGLDPFPFSGGTTTVESLWMGVPVVTLNGERLVARQGAGLLTAAGLSEWIANDPDRYVGIAVRAAADLPGLAATRASLRERLRQSPVLDGRRFAKEFGAALFEMWKQRHHVPGRTDKSESSERRVT